MHAVECDRAMHVTSLMEIAALCTLIAAQMCYTEQNPRRKELGASCSPGRAVYILSEARNGVDDHSTLKMVDAV